MKNTHYYLCGTDGKCDERCDHYHKDQSCLNTYKRAHKGVYVDRDKEKNTYNFFISKGIHVTICLDGFLLDGRFVFSPMDNKWKNTKKDKWYRSFGPEAFYKKYFIKNKQENK